MSLTHAGVWADDSLVDDLRLIRGEVRKPGCCVVEIRMIAEPKSREEEYARSMRL